MTDNASPTPSQAAKPAEVSADVATELANRDAFELDDDSVSKAEALVNIISKIYETENVALATERREQIVRSLLFEPAQTTVAMLLARLKRLRSSHDALVAEVERLKAERRWIPVGEKLPDKKDHFASVDVLFAVAGKTYFGYWHDNGHWYDYAHTINSTDVTHWQLLPQAPAGTEVEGE